MPDRLVLLHALRLALIHRIWLLAVELPDFSPRHGATRETMVPACCNWMWSRCWRRWRRSSPPPPGAVVGLDFHEPRAGAGGAELRPEHAAIFRPMGRLFGLVRGCGAAITHEVGAFG